MHILWAAVSDEVVSSIKIRQWCSQLLDRSIFSGACSTGLKVHDICRDFTSANFTPDQLREIQQKFVNELISRCTAKSSVPASVSEYATCSLAYHVHSAVTAPFCDDPFVKGWLLGSNANIVDQVMLGKCCGPMFLFLPNILFCF